MVSFSSHTNILRDEDYIDSRRDHQDAFASYSSNQNAFSTLERGQNEALNINLDLPFNEHSEADLLSFENYLSRIQDGEVGEDDFSDPDYNLEDDDDDYQDVIVEHETIKKAKGRPKEVANSVPPTLGIHIPEVNDKSDSDFTDSEELLDGELSDKEGNEEESVHYEEYDVKKHKNIPILELGMKFSSLKQFKDACKNYGIMTRFQLRFSTNDKKRVVCKCKKRTCPFKVYATAVSKTDPTIQIKSCILKHTDGNVFVNRHMNSEWLAERYFSIFRIDPSWSLKGLIGHIIKDYNYTISYSKAWRTKDKALKWVYGDEATQYAKLLSYREELLKTNPGSTVILWRDEGRFLGFYVCLGALKNAFKSGCRPLISLDGCWLKGNYGGNLLSAVAIDPNDCIFPVAYAVIAESESRETWSWFLENLGDDLEIQNSHHISFMSDRQKGLIRAVKDLYPNAEHRNCVRHMYQNFRQKHKGKKLKDLVWNAARASNEVMFNKCMDELENEDKEAREWFNHPERPFNTWTRALFKCHTRCDMLLNNLCESFNRYILDAREKPIITMLEMIKNQLMKRLFKKKEWIERFQGICPKIEKKLIKIGKEATNFKPDFSGGPKVLVEGPGGKYIVDMIARTCTCRRWDLTGLPCPHALVSILGNNEILEDYVIDYYKVQTYKNVYAHYINPTTPEEQWAEVVGGGDVLPPRVVKTKKGRKPKARKKEAEELEKQRDAVAQAAKDKRTEKRKPEKLSKKGTIQISCSICKMVGHNARGHGKYAETTSPNINEEPEDAVEAEHNVAETESTFVENELVELASMQGVFEVVNVSKSGREVKKRVMKDYVQAVMKKKCRLSKEK